MFVGKFSIEKWPFLSQVLIEMSMIISYMVHHNDIVLMMMEESASFLLLLLLSIIQLNS